MRGEIALMGFLEKRKPRKRHEAKPVPAPEKPPRSWRVCGCGREFFGRGDVCTPCRVEVG